MGVNPIVVLPAALGKLAKPSPFHGEDYEFEPRTQYLFGVVVEMVTMSPCHGEGRGFESLRSRILTLSSFG